MTALGCLAAGSAASAQYTMNYHLNHYAPYPAGTSILVGDVNSYGHLTYAINEPPALRGVYIWAGFVPVKIIGDGGGTYMSFGAPDINCQGHVVVRAQRPFGAGDDILFWNGGATPTVVASWFATFGDPAINDSDEAVWADFDSPGIGYNDCAAGPWPMMLAITGTNAIGPRVDINNVREVSYTWTDSPTTFSEVRKFSLIDGSDCLVHHSSGGGIYKNSLTAAINRQGFVGYFQIPHYFVGNCSGSNSLLVANPGGIAYTQKLDLNYHFAGSWAGSDFLSGVHEHGIYGGPNPAIHKILRTGQPFPPNPAKIIGGANRPGGINNRGQVAYSVTFTDGTVAVGRADPFVMTPDPEGCPNFAPVNDLIEDAVLIGLGAFEVDTYLATTDGPNLPADCEKGFGGSFEADVWYLFTAKSSGCVEVSLCEFANFDTRLAVYDAANGAPTEKSTVACNDDACGLASRLVFPASAGGSYYIRVGGWGGFTGNALLTVTPSDEDCGSDCGTDLNCDGMIDAADLAELLLNWGGSGQGDLNGDGVVDSADLGILLGAWGGSGG